MTEFPHIELPGCYQTEEERNVFLGGTDLAALCGVSNWGNPMSVYMDKKGIQYPSKDSELLMLGREIEPVIAKLYEFRNQDIGLTVREIGRVRHKNLSWAGASPDRIVFDMSGHVLKGLEIKNVSTFAQKFKVNLYDDELESFIVEQKWGREGTDEIPLEYLVQVHWYMVITGLREWDIAALFGGATLKLYHVDFNPEFAANLIQCGQEFWDAHIVQDVPPRIDGSKFSRYYLENAYGKQEKDFVLNGDIHIDKMLDTYMYHRACIAQHEAERDLVANRLRDIIRHAEGVKGSVGSAWWRYPKNSKKENPSRIFRVVEAKDRGYHYECSRADDG